MWGLATDSELRYWRGKVQEALLVAGVCKKKAGGNCGTTLPQNHPQYSSIPVARCQLHAYYFWHLELAK